MGISSGAGSALEPTCRRTRFTAAAIVIAFLLLLSGGSAAPSTPSGGKGPVITAVPGDVSADRFGVVSSHLPLYTPDVMDAELDAAAAAGAGWVRSVFAWWDMEPFPGLWIFAGTDNAARKARDRGIKLLGVLFSSPPWANGGNSWNYPPTNIEAWKNYVRTVVSRYRGQVAAWEVWNEQNISQFWKPSPSPEAYVTLLAATAQAAREVDPRVKLVMGGLAGLDPAFLDRCLALGAAEHVDALAYHPYPEALTSGDYTPQEALTRYIVLYVRWKIRQYTTRNLEIWLTEFGWTTCAASPPGVSEGTQASYMLRSFINYTSTEVDKVFYFNLRDGLLHEHHRYGLLRNDFTEKPSYRYYRNFMRLFHGASAAPPGAAAFSCGAHQTLEAHVFETPDGGMNIAAWKSDDAADSLTVTLSDPSFEMPLLLNMDNGAAEPAPGAVRGPDGIITVSDLPVGADPAVLRFDPLLRVTSITPKSCVQGFSVNITDLAGNGFLPDATVRIEKVGGTQVYHATRVVVVNENKITCTINLQGAGAPLGRYDVVVRNPDGHEGRLSGGFSVTNICGFGGAVSLWLFASMLGLLSAAAAVTIRGRGRRHPVIPSTCDGRDGRAGL